MSDVIGSSVTGSPVAGAAVVCLLRDQVLLVRRGKEPNFGRWSYPGGRINPGETARQAAVREALEETGLRMRVLDVIDVYDAIFPPWHYCVADFLAVPEDETAPMAGDDVLEARWVPFEDLHQYDVTEAMERVLDRARWLFSLQPNTPPSLGMELEPVAPPGFSSRAELRRRVRGLYVITDDSRTGERGHVEVARAALKGGARLVQLRDKRRDTGELLPLAREIRTLCREAGALFIVNDRIDLALAAEADGVHLGPTDFPVREARQLVGPERLIGVSVDSLEQVEAAEAEDADYLGVGAVYGSGTKLDAGDAVGPQQVSRFREASTLPIVAIGGITLERVPEVRAAGAHAVAVISAVSAAEDPLSAARALSEACEAPLPAD
ncbi:MAG: thiamine phosphate synthase [Armatimonadota bacterium]